jgi:acyl-CoA synthetase (AMP-forming)/AMP-acid ligase II
MDEDGYFYIADRTKDMLIVSGYKVFSREVEEVLSEYQAVELCAIIGIANPERPDSQIVKAVIQLSKDAQGKGQEVIKKEILEHCKENLAPYKIPKVIVFTEALPLTAVGKVDKKVLRTM